MAHFATKCDAVCGAEITCGGQGELRAHVRRLHRRGMPLPASYAMPGTGNSVWSYAPTILLRAARY
eukprot:2829043-Rhodomonas_salina.2